jgi:ERCC4-type nuclease
MPISLRIPANKEEIIRRAAKKAGKTKTTFILEAVDEKLGLTESREQLIRKTAGWLGPKEASELRKHVKAFRNIHEGDWE